MPTCATQDLDVIRGDEFEHTYRFTSGGAPLDVTGYGGMIFQVRLESRQNVDEDPVAAATVDDSDADTGVIVAVIPASTTAALDPEARYVYDAQLLTPPTTFARGRFTVSPDVSRP